MKRSRLLTLEQLEEAGACSAAINEVRPLLPLTITVQKAGKFAVQDSNKWCSHASWCADALLNQEHTEEFSAAEGKASGEEKLLKGEAYTTTVERNNILLVKLFARLYIKEGGES